MHSNAVLLERLTDVYNPYERAVPAPTFRLTSPEFDDGGRLPVESFGGEAGRNESPALSWGPLPQGTRSVLVTAFDADAPIPGGLWHWAVKDVPADAGGLDHGAGGQGAAGLPAGAAHLSNSLGLDGFAGAQPPPGTGTHHLYFAVTALDLDKLSLPDDASLALVHAMIIPHTLGRALLTATADAPPV